MKIAYLASHLTLPGSARRRSDAIEHDQIMSVLRRTFKANSSIIDDIAWDASDANWSSYDAAVIGTTWDYCDRCDEFLATLGEINKATPVFNPPELVAWNSHKNYLRNLQQLGLQIIPTRWLDQPHKAIDWPEMFEHFAVDKLVVKRQIGANAEGQFLLDKGAIAPELTHPAMVQPFLTTVVDEGEYSFIFIDGELSHALIKRPIAGDYRIQSSYGGTESATTPSPNDVLSARMVLEVLDELPLYARVDMLRDDNGNLSLMELELIEPFLYPLQGPNLGEHFLNALKKRVS